MFNISWDILTTPNCQPQYFVTSLTSLMFDLASFSQEIRSCYGLQLRVCVCVCRYLEEIFSVQSLISALACGSYHIFLKQLEHSSDHRFGPNGKEIKAIASPFIRACVCVQSEDFLRTKRYLPCGSTYHIFPALLKQSQYY